MNEPRDWSACTITERFVDDRRTRVAPLIARIEEPAAVERADVFLPQQRAVHVVADHQADRSEHRDDVPAVGDRRGVGLTRLGVALGQRLADERLPLPDDLAGRAIERIDAIAVHRQVVDGVTSPYRPVRNDVSSSLAAVTTMTRSPQTMGLDVASPGIGVFQLTFVPVATSHSVTTPWPSATPAALAPRNAGHGCGCRAWRRVGESVAVRRRRGARVHAGIRRGRRRVAETLALVAHGASAANDRQPLDDAAAARERHAHFRRIVCDESPLFDRLQAERRSARRRSAVSACPSSVTLTLAPVAAF